MSPETVWQDPAFTEGWNTTYGLDMENSPLRQGLIYPLFRKYACPMDGKILADFGCGNGNLIRHFAQEKFRVWHGYDNGSAILTSAMQQSTDPRVIFINRDLSVVQKLVSTVDILTSVLMLEEIPNAGLLGLFTNVASLLGPSSKVLFFIHHPVNTMVEDRKSTRPGEIQKFEGHQGYFDTRPTTYRLTVLNGRDGFPVKPTYHHRPLGVILNTAAQAGLCVDELIEIPKNVKTLGELAEHKPDRMDYPSFAFIRMSLR